MCQTLCVHNRKSYILTHSLRLSRCLEADTKPRDIKSDRFASGTAILRRTKRAMGRAMCSQKVVNRKTIEEQLDMFGLKETIDQLATANGVRRYGHVLRRDDDSVLRVALDLKVNGKRKRGQPKKT